MVLWFPVVKESMFFKYSDSPWMLGPLHYIRISFPPDLTGNLQSLHFITFLLHLTWPHWHPRNMCGIEHVNRKVYYIWFGHTGIQGTSAVLNMWIGKFITFDSAHTGIQGTSAVLNMWTGKFITFDSAHTGIQGTSAVLNMWIGKFGNGRRAVSLTL